MYTRYLYRLSTLLIYLNLGPDPLQVKCRLLNYDIFSYEFLACFFTNLFLTFFLKYAGNSLKNMCHNLKVNIQLELDLRQPLPFSFVKCQHRETYKEENFIPLILRFVYYRLPVFLDGSKSFDISTMRLVVV